MFITLYYSDLIQKGVYAQSVNLHVPQLTCVCLLQAAFHLSVF